MYTVQQLADIAHVSPRTLRWYDKQGLLVPARAENGYRLYTEAQLDLLQQILFWRALDISLADIKKMLAQPAAHRLKTLKEQRRLTALQLENCRRRLDTIDRTIRSLEEEIPMNNKEKFDCFKTQVEENEARWGDEARKKYGKEAVDASAAKLRGMDEKQYAAMTEAEEEMLALLKKPALTEEEAARVCSLHRKWLLFSWKSCTAAAHKGLAAMYTADERFCAYYEERAGKGAAHRLADAIRAHAKD